MARVKVDELKVGMVLQADVIDKNGRMIVPKGVTLTDRHLRAFPMWGIEYVDVGSGAPEEASPGPQNPQMNTAQAESVRARFQYANLDHLAVAELLAIAITKAK